jgi:hypothetical protein
MFFKKSLTDSITARFHQYVPHVLPQAGYQLDALPVQTFKQRP